VTDHQARILITGANGFIGSRVMRSLLARGFTNLVCVSRSSGQAIEALAEEFPDATIEVINGDLLSRDTCEKAAVGVEIVYHLAAGMGRSYPVCILNSVVTTRNLLDALVAQSSLRRFVNVSSLSVYSNEQIPRRGQLTEEGEIDSRLPERHDPYAYAKAKQDELVAAYGRSHGLRFVTVRPGLVIGPGKPRIPGRVGHDTFGVFLHLGLGNEMPFTYVDNCADAIVLAGLTPGVDGQVFIVVDDDRPTSREYLRRFKQRVGRFRTIAMPYRAYYLLNFLLERYSQWSAGQLPPTFNRRICRTYYKGNTYSNAKAKRLLDWSPQVSMDEALDRCFDFVLSTKGSK
jgi:nucleoside-diphosphate-sugar epimerase